jgi:hypothetical protein
MVSLCVSTGARPKTHRRSTNPAAGWSTPGGGRPTGAQVMPERDGVEEGEMLERADWTTVELDK